jgi:hypothetical protein
VSSQNPHCAYRKVEFDYLCVDQFVEDFVGARALASALESGIIDDLLQYQPCGLRDMGSRQRIDKPGLHLLLGLLRANNVVEIDDDSVRLSESFVAALRFRDLLETKLYFTNLVAPDFLGLFTVLISNPGQFFQQARLFDLFSYARCFEPTPDNYKLTAQWMRITTAFTKYEAEACMKFHEFSCYERQLDIGGNSGEFVLRICKKYPRIHAVVYDLPLVCDIGSKHVSCEPEADRIEFVKVSGSHDTPPRGFDLVTFKSMLHDWPEREMGEFLGKAYDSLTTGGTLLIFERAHLEIGDRQVPYSVIPFMLFFRSYRSPEIYKSHLERLNFRDIEIRFIELEMTFILITAIK